MNVDYISPCLDSSGYAEAARNNILALNRVGIQVKPIPISFESSRSDLGENGSIIRRLMSITPNNPSKIQLIHCTPENYPKLIKSDKYNIGYCAWETDRLPKGWANLINKLDEVWVPSQYNKDAFELSGVTIPIRIFPHTFNVGPKPNKEAKPAGSEFIFYSIFQWLERKNPVGLLKAYLTEFTKEDNVCLILKTFFFNHGSTIEHERIRQVISDIKSKLYLENYPKVMLITDLMSSEGILDLHRTGDCYVHLSRSEGFGIPIVEAMMQGNPVITTDYSAPPEFIEQYQTGYLVNCMETPVCGMPWPLYTGDMLWAEPSVLSTRLMMREVYLNRQQALQVGHSGYNVVKERFDWEVVGKAMAERLKELS